MEDTALSIVVELLEALVSERDTAELLQTLAERSAALVGDVDVAVMLADAGQPRVVAATSSDAELLDLLQLEEAQGPCLQAMSQGTLVVESDIAAASERWGAWGDDALRIGYAAVASAPLRYDGTSHGSLTALRRSPGPFDDDHVAALGALADVTILVLLGARRVDDADRTAAQLQSALSSRIVIEQAKGMVAARTGTTPDEAFQRLRKLARDRQCKLQDLARAVVEEGLAVDA